VRRLKNSNWHSRTKDMDPGPPGLLADMPVFSINSEYDKDVADAIEYYKKQKNILNYAGRIDRIVGIKTIHELDKEATRRKQVDPDPRPVHPLQVSTSGR
jgi:hypothetical protein